MNSNPDRIKKIVWIDGSLRTSGTTTNFIYNITAALPLNLKNITVQMLKFIVPNNNFATNAYYLKVYGDLGVSHNQYSLNYASYLLLGLINVQGQYYYYDGINDDNYNLESQCEENINKQIKYDIGRPQNFINIMVLNEDNAVPAMIDASALQNCLICLEFEYELE